MALFIPYAVRKRKPHRPVERSRSRSRSKSPSKDRKRRKKKKHGSQDRSLERALKSRDIPRPRPTSVSSEDDSESSELVKRVGLEIAIISNKTSVVCYLVDVKGHVGQFNPKPAIKSNTSCL